MATIIEHNASVNGEPAMLVGASREVFRITRGHPEYDPKLDDIHLPERSSVVDEHGASHWTYKLGMKGWTIVQRGDDAVVTIEGREEAMKCTAIEWSSSGFSTSSSVLYFYLRRSADTPARGPV